MSYQPFDRKGSGIVFFGSSPTDQVYESVATFTYDTGNNSLKLADGGFLGSQSYYNALSIASNGNATFAQNLSIGGNLTVNGTTTTVNSTVVTIQDPIIVLGSGSPTTDDNKDRGIAFNWHNGSTAKTGWFGYDDSVGKFTFIPDATIASEVVSGTSGIIVATLEGNASTSTQLLNSRNFSMTGEMTAGAVGFDGTANVVLTGVLHESAISAQAAITSVDDVGTDYILIWDDTDDDLKKITRANFVSGLGSMSNFNVSGVGNANQQITNGETLVFAQGTAINFTISATDTVSGTLNSAVAGNGLTMANQILAVGAGDGISVASDTIAVTDGSGILVNTGGVHANLVDYTVQTVAAAARTTTASRTYAIQVNSSDQLVVNVPWTDADTTYTAGSGLTLVGTTFHIAPSTAGSGLVLLSDGLHLDLNEYSDTAVGFDDAFLTLDSNNVNEQLTTVQGLGTYFTGSGLAVDGVGKIRVGAGNGITVNAGDVSLATSTAGAGLSYNAGVLAVDLNEFSDTAVGFDDAFATLDSDNATEQLTTVQSLGSYYAGSGMLADGVGKLHWRPTTASVAASAQLSANDVNLCTAGAGGISVWLPSGTAGRFMWIKKVDGGAGTVTVNRQGTYTIDGANSIILYHQYEGVELVCDGSNWFIV